VALDARRVVPELLQALAHLGQKPPAELSGAGLDSLWGWAIANWVPPGEPSTRAAAG
jgi:hypothetical protein